MGSIKRILGVLVICILVLTWVRVCDKNYSDTSNQLSVYISNKQVYETTLSDDFGKLAGVRISFEGFGQVKNLQLSAEGQEVLSIP